MNEMTAFGRHYTLVGRKAHVEDLVQLVYLADTNYFTIT